MENELNLELKFDFELLRNLFNCIERIISDERGNEINDGDGILRTADNDASPTRLEEWKKSIDFIPLSARHVVACFALKYLIIFRSCKKKKNNVKERKKSSNAQCKKSASRTCFLTSSSNVSHPLGRPLRSTETKAICIEITSHRRDNETYITRAIKPTGEATFYEIYIRGRRVILKYRMK